IKRRALAALARMGSGARGAAQALKLIYQGEQDDEIRILILNAMVQMGSSASDAVQNLMNASDRSYQSILEQAKAGDVHTLLLALKSGNRGIRSQAVSIFLTQPESGFLELDASESVPAL